jgi:hypothetical protein
LGAPKTASGQFSAGHNSVAFPRLANWKQITTPTSEKRPEQFFSLTRVFYCKNFSQAWYRVGGALVVWDPKAAKKPYRAPAFQILDAGAAKAELEATGAMNDANARQILSVLNQKRDGKPSPTDSAERGSLP